MSRLRRRWRAALAAEPTARRQRRLTLRASVPVRQRLAALLAELAASRPRPAVRAGGDRLFLAHVDAGRLVGVPGLVMKLFPGHLRLDGDGLAAQVRGAGGTQAGARVPALLGQTQWPQRVQERKCCLASPTAVS